MRRTLAVLLDVVLGAVCAFAGFRLAYWAAHCADPSDCFYMPPLVIACALLGLILYFGLAQRFWHLTPGERVFRPPVGDDGT